MIRLSICIPTFNRADYLEKLLKVISYQQCDGLEVVVADNASTDQTEKVCHAFGVVYIKNAANLGPDRNAMVAVGHARGQYCWILGDDDLISCDAIAHLFPHLDGQVSGVTFHVDGFDKEMRNKIRMYSDLKRGERERLEGISPILEKIGTSMSYLGAQVFKRSLWQEIISREPVERYFEGYFHVYVIYRIIQAAPTWLYLPEVLVYWRSFNETRRNERAIDTNQERLLIDAFSFEKILRDVFGSGACVYRHGLRTYLGVHVQSRILLLKRLRAPLLLHLRNLFTIGRKYWDRPVFWLRIVPIICTPWWILAVARVGVQQMRRIRENCRQAEVFFSKFRRS